MKITVLVLLAMVALASAAGPGNFEFFKDAGHKWRFRFKAGNGEIQGSSEAYESKNNAIKGAEATARYIVRKDADPKYIKFSTDGKHFNIVAPNGEKVFHSEVYANAGAAKNGATQLKKNIKASLLNFIKSKFPTKIGKWNGFEIKQAAGTKFSVALVGGNGEIMAHSEVYNTADAAFVGIRATLNNGLWKEEQYGKVGKTWHLKAQNGEKLMHSEELTDVNAGINRAVERIRNARQTLFSEIAAASAPAPAPEPEQTSESPTGALSPPSM